MGEKLIVGPIPGGIQTNVTPFNIDNGSFPALINAYQWRGRVKRKRGTELLGRLTRFFNSTSTAYSATSTLVLVGPNANLLTGFGLQANASLVPGTISIADITSGNTFTDPGSDGILVGAPGGAGTVNYSTGEISINSGGAPGDSITAQFNYYPSLPVMGIEEFIDEDTIYPLNISFDTTYSYSIAAADPYPIHDVSFYKNPTTGTYTNYVAKGTYTSVSWHGQDYQQFWTVNYQGALWATNGVTNPFNVTNIGMQFKNIVAVTVIGGVPPSTVTLQINAHDLSVGDFLFINEVVGTTGINFQTGYVTTVTDINNVIVTFPNATIATNGSGGIAQYLTRNATATKDCIRFYDGDPTNGSAVSPALSGIKGWVNFMPPISQSNMSIGNLPADKYYLVGAKMIVPFKDRLLFIAPVVQTSSGSPKYLKDTVIYSQNGTPYYTASYTNSVATVDSPTSSNITFNAILVPSNQSATSPAYFGDSTGFGGFVSSGIDENINTASSNEDVLILGFDKSQVRFVYSGNDIVPFVFYVINSELGSQNTFSAINMDVGVISRGSRGFIISNQTRTDRIDLQIPEEVFQLRSTDNGNERLCAQRDFDNEWIFFTYPVSNLSWKFPSQTLLYNYRDQTWGIFRESFTTYGTFTKLDGLIWSTVGFTFPTWAQWDQPWAESTADILKPNIAGGNQQGFVLLRDKGTSEGNSLYIQGISGNTVTSPNHGLNQGDYIIISGALGTIASEVNGRIFNVATTPTDSTFTLVPNISSGTYIGGGLIKRMYVPFIQTKQFPTAWAMGRKTRIGMQQYLLTSTYSSQITLYIYLSQNSDNPYNQGPIVPEISENNALIYSSILYTCTESSNLGLSPANTNLLMISEINNAGTSASSPQSQIWHRVNTSLIGDTVQLGFTMSDEQMTSYSTGEAATITNISQATNCVVTCVNSIGAGSTVRITGVVGMIQLNNNIYVVVSRTDSQLTLNVDSTAFTAYTSGGTATLVAPQDQFAEIELHGFILDVSPSQLLS